MNKRAPRAVVLGALLAVTSWAAFASTPTEAVEASPWDVREVVTSAPLRRSVDARTLDPSAYASVRLDHRALRAQLASVRGGRSSRSAGTTIRVPAPDGALRSFSVTESDLFEPGLAERFPDIKAYMGTATDGSGDRIRFELSPRGFRAQVSSAEGWWYVDPELAGATGTYLSYFKSDLRNRSEWSEDPAMADVHLRANDFVAESTTAARSNGAQLRTYRLAVATDSTYSNSSEGGGTINSVTSAITTVVNRLNGIYTPELSIRFQLVASNSELIFLNDVGTCAGNGAGPDCDPFSTDDSDNLDANQTLIDDVIGDANYDIGHVITGTNCGLAAGSVVGRSGSKALGCSGLNPPSGDPFIVDYLAHEIGHQFGAEHTFNSCAGANSNRVSGSAYEPGSASTILGYAGLCGSDDVQREGDPANADGASDPYFHSQSYEEIIEYTTTSGSPGNLGAANNGNSLPRAEAGANGVIPDSTPFRLTGTSSDADGGQVLTHRWEQRDLGARASFTNPQVSAGPLFRSLPATTSATRYLPKLSAIAAGNTNLATTCPAPPADADDRQCWAEYVPDMARTMNFRLTVLDGIGGVDTDDIQVTVVDTPSPFAVTSPNGGDSPVGGTSFEVKWDVAGTSAAPISAATVNIRASLNDGLTYPYLLAEATSNDGSQFVTLPDVSADATARIMVESTNEFCGVHFFDVSDATFTLRSSGTNSTPATEPACTPPPADVVSLSPARFADTRPSGETFDDEFDKFGKLPAGFEYRVTIGNRGEVPSTANAVVANVTAVDAEAPGFVTVHPCESTLPLASSLNYYAGVNLGNEIFAPLTSDGDLCIFTSASAHITVDVTGYVPAASTTIPVTPARFLDTRRTGATFDGLYQRAGKLAGGSVGILQVADRGDVLADAVAVIVNVTAVDAEAPGYLTVYPCSPTRPTASSLNYYAGVNRGNELIAQVDADGEICLFTSATTHLIADVVGFLSPGSDLASVAPVRLLETRPTETTVDGVSEGIGKLEAGRELEVQVSGRGGVDNNATSAIINVTVVDAEAAGFVTVHPCEPTLPLASSLNYYAGVNGGNEIVARLDTSGSLCIYTSARAHLVADVVGYVT